MKIVYNVNLFCQNTRLIPLSEDLKRERGLFVLPITNCWLFHISAWKVLVHELHLHPLGTVIWLLKNGCLLHCHFDTVMNTCMSRALTVGPVHTVCVAASDVRSRLGSKTKQQAKASKLTISASSQPESKATSGVFSRLGKKSAASWYHLWHLVTSCASPYIWGCAVIGLVLKVHSIGGIRVFCWVLHQKSTRSLLGFH